MITVAAAVADLGDRFAAAGVPTPQPDAELLVRHVLGWDRARYVASFGDDLPAAAAEQLEGLARRRERREPLQLILGSVGFRHLDILVRPGVFIPRPETEILAGAAIERTPPDGIVVEPCTGTGAVACAVAAEADPAQVVATDIVGAAVALAMANVDRCGVAVTVRHGDLLAPVDRRLQGHVDVLVANPPYLAAGELPPTAPEVTSWDPARALVAGPTGHEISDRLIDEAGRWLRPGGWLLLEVDERRAAEVSRRAGAAGLVETTVLRDLTGRDRIIAARRSNISDNTAPHG